MNKLFGATAAVAVAAVLFASPASVRAAVNLIANPSLETPGTGGNPASWSQAFWGSVTPTFGYPVSGRTAGTSAASVTLAANTTGDARWAHQNVPVTAGTTYTYSNWYTSTVATEVNVEFTHANGSLSYGWLADAPSSAGVWKQVSATLVVPAGVTSLNIYQLIDKAGTLTIGDVSLIAGTPTPDPNPVPNPDPDPDPVPNPNAFSEGMVTLSFDDSWLSQYESALPILNAAGIKATFYLTTQPIRELWDGFITAAQARLVRAAGHEIGGHTVTHVDLTTIGSTSLTREILNSKTYLQRIISGITVRTLAYPYGSYNNAVITRARQLGYTSARSVEEGLNFKNTDTMILKSFSPVLTTQTSVIKASIDQAIAEKGWFILTLHEIDNSGGEYSTTATQLEDIVDYIKTKGVKTVTIEEGAALIGTP